MIDHTFYQQIKKIIAGRHLGHVLLILYCINLASYQIFTVATKKWAQSHFELEGLQFKELEALAAEKSVVEGDD